MKFGSWVAGVAFVGIVAIQAAVIAVGWKDPSKLMLTEMTGPEFTQHQRTMTGGDSITGAQPEILNVPGGPAPPATPKETEQ